MDEVVLLDYVGVSHVVVAGQENVKLAFLDSVAQESQSIQASVLEVFLGAVALALGENTKHELNLTVKRGKLPSNLHNNLLLKLLRVDQVMGYLVKEAFIMSGLKVHDVDSHLKLADYGLRVHCFDRELLMHRTAGGERR